MKKIFTIISGFLTALFVSGCTLLGTFTGKTPEQLHDEAVDKVTEYISSIAIHKIEASQDLSEEGKQRLKGEVEKLREEILVRIDALRDKMVENKKDAE